MNHLDTIPAMQAAFAVGRAEYLRREKMLAYDCSNALRAYRKLTGEIEANPEFAPVIGGGASATGKILWLLENRGAMTTAQISELVSLASISQLLSNLRAQGRVSRDGKMWKSRKAVSV